MLFILDFKAFTDIFHFHRNAFASYCWQMRRVKIVGWRCWTSGCVAFVVLLCACMGGKCGRKQLSYGSLSTSLKVFWRLRILLPRRPVPERNAGDDRIPCAMERFLLLCAYRQLVRIFWLILPAPDFIARAYAYNCMKFGIFTFTLHSRARTSLRLAEGRQDGCFVWEEWFLIFCVYDGVKVIVWAAKSLWIPRKVT